MAVWDLDYHGFPVLDFGLDHCASQPFCMRAVESDSVNSARKDELHEAHERASETRERTLHRQEQNRMCMTSKEQDRMHKA